VEAASFSSATNVISASHTLLAAMGRILAATGFLSGAASVLDRARLSGDVRIRFYDTGLLQGIFIVSVHASGLALVTLTRTLRPFLPQFLISRIRRWTFHSNELMRRGCSGQPIFLFAAPFAPAPRSPPEFA
jgi:hypothetical protein